MNFHKIQLNEWPTKIELGRILIMSSLEKNKQSLNFELMILLIKMT